MRGQCFWEMCEPCAQSNHSAAFPGTQTRSIPTGSELSATRDLSLAPPGAVSPGSESCLSRERALGQIYLPSPTHSAEKS